MPDTPPPKTLRDRLRMLRRHLLVIAIAVVAAAAVAVILAAGQVKTYTATATVNFVDPLRNAGIIGGQSANTLAATISAAGLAQLTESSTLMEVKRDLQTPLSVNTLRSDVNAVADPNTNLVTVTASGKSGLFASRLANSVVDQTKSDADQQASLQFQRLAEQYQRQLAALSPAQRRNDLTTSTLIENLARASAVAHGGATAAIVVARAQVPTSPSSPKPVFDGIVGAFLGLIIGLAVAGLREAVDRRLKGLKDIEDELNLPILGHLREGALGKSVVGAEGEQFEPADHEAIRMLRANVEFLDAGNPVKTVVVTSALPAEGKTTVAAALAATAASSGRRTLLIECDLRRPTLADRLKMVAQPGLREFLMGQAAPQEVLRSVLVSGPEVASSAPGVSSGETEPERWLVVIPAGSTTDHSAALLSSPRFHELLEQVSQTYDLVVLDTPPLLPIVDALEIIPYVDSVLVCLRGSRTTREQVRAAKVALERLPQKPMGIVLTGVSDSREADTYSYYYSYSSAKSEGSKAVA